MGKVKSFSVEFKNNRLVYAPGDLLEGMVCVSLKKQKKVKKIKISCVGQCEVKVKNGGDLCKNTEKYFEYDFDVHNGLNELSTGDHKFPFQIQLPPNLPTSFEGDGGHVRYSITGTIEYDTLFSGRTQCMVAFTIINPVDLNAMAEVRQPVRLFCERKASGMLFWKKPQVSINLSIDKCGFVPGEYIKLSGIIANGSDKPLKHFKLTLTQNLTYFARKKGASPTSAPESIKTSKNVAFGLEKNSLVGNKSVVWDKHPILCIPPLVPSILQNCRIINVSYHIDISAMVEGVISEEFIQTKSQNITIGSVPLMSHDFVNSVPPQIQTAPTAPPLITDNIQDMPPPYEMGTAPPLPSYEEACTGGAALSPTQSQSNNDEMVQSNMQFTPQYAVYANWEPSQPATNPAFTS